MKKLPENWNKQFQFVKIRSIPNNFIERLFPKENYVGYSWPTNNWVEVHCFESERDEYSGLTICDRNCEVYTEGETYPRLMMKLFRTQSRIFHNRIKSFIIDRKNVFFSRPSIIYCNPKEEDFQRWKEWHPNDNYITVFEGEKIYYFGQTHQDLLELHRINKDGSLSEDIGVHLSEDEIEKLYRGNEIEI